MLSVSALLMYTAKCIAPRLSTNYFHTQIGCENICRYKKPKKLLKITIYKNITSVTEVTLELGTLLTYHFSKLDFIEVTPKPFQ